jgi:hypothetical protein
MDPFFLEASAYSKPDAGAIPLRLPSLGRMGRPINLPLVHVKPPVRSRFTFFQFQKKIDSEKKSSKIYSNKCEKFHIWTNLNLKKLSNFNNLKI